MHSVTTCIRTLRHGRGTRERKLPHVCSKPCPAGFSRQHAAVTKRLTRDGKPVPMQIQKNMLRKSVQSSCNKTRTSSNPCFQEAVFERSGPAVFIKASALDVQLVQFKALLPYGRCVEQAATTCLALRGVASRKLHPLFLPFVVVEVGVNPQAASRQEPLNLMQ